MRTPLLSGFVVIAALLAAPVMALQSVTLPQAPGDNAANSQDANNPAQDPFSTDQSNDKSSNSFGSFHFNMSSGQDWPGDPYHTYRPQSSTPDAYGNAAAPGSEFSTSNLFYPH